MEIDGLAQQYGDRKFLARTHQESPARIPSLVSASAHYQLAGTASCLVGAGEFHG
jgi:hypothetical protein